MHLISAQIAAHSAEKARSSRATQHWQMVGMACDRSVVYVEVRRARGFTLVELVMTIVIVGILAAVAAPRFFDNNVFQTRGAADQIQSALRYGQKIAVAQRRDVVVLISAATNSNCGTQLTAGNINCVVANSVSVLPALPKTVTFNALGQPVPNAADSITVGTTVITIERETGYVHSP